MNDTRRLITFFVITFAILLLTNIDSAPDTAATRVTTPQETVIRVDSGVPAVEQEVVVDRPSFRAVFSNLGGRLKSLYVKKYDVQLVPSGQYLFATSLGHRDLSRIAFENENAGRELVFRAQIDGQSVEKRYIFDQDCGFSLKLESAPSNVIMIHDLSAGLALTEPKNKADDLKHYAVYARGEELRNIGKDKKSARIWQRSPRWLGFRTKYFLLAVVNRGQIDSLLTLPLADRRVGLKIFGGNTSDLVIQALPIQYDRLRSSGEGFEELAKGGVFGPIARFFLAVLGFFNRFLGNYGLAIILFALIIKAVFMPLSLNMVKAQKKMQVIQPEIKKIQERYKDNPAEMNRQVMAMYKAFKVNPLSGCLPLLIQIPIFMALYSTLTTSIELRRAPFAFWISDLSLKDPYYILPIAMGVMSILQSLFTLTDPRQKMMVILMPVFMTYIFLFMPSGLQLYWFIYTVFSLVEQFAVKRSGGSK
jgi:YidC/Oxa1 family membrane protein insertase